MYFDSKSESEKDTILKKIYPELTSKELEIFKREIPEELRQPESIADK